MRRRLLLIFVLVYATACGSGDQAAEQTAAPKDLETKTIEAGEVTVEIDPIRIDAGGAAFEITLDTHSVDLDMDLEADASLTVDGDAWTAATWDGDPPSGHHREGRLSFEPAGDARGVARLVLNGFTEPVEAEWRIEDA